MLSKEKHILINLLFSREDPGEGVQLSITYQQGNNRTYIFFLLFIIPFQFVDLFTCMFRLSCAPILPIENLGYRHIDVGTHIFDSDIGSMSSWISRGEITKDVQIQASNKWITRWQANYLMVQGLNKCLFFTGAARRTC
jgi:hypothetical protein